MKVFTEILGNINNSADWKEKLDGFDVDFVVLDQWTTQKSRFLGKGTSGTEYPVALQRHSKIVDGDVIYYDPEARKAAVLRVDLSPVLVIDLSSLADKDHDTIIRTSMELGHAIGNQHWPAVVKGTKVYVPLTVDKTVMLSVLETHHIEGITFDFHSGLDIIPYLAPHEVRRLFGGASHESHSHVHGHEHLNDHCHEHTHDGVTHSHPHCHEDGDFHNHHHHDPDSCGCCDEPTSIH